MIANEFGEAANQPLHKSALFAAGLVLFLLTLAVNAAARAIVQRSERGQRAAPAETAGTASAGGGGRMSSLPPVSARRRRTDRVMRALLGAATVARADPARPRHLLPAQGPRRPQLELLHHRPHGQLPRRPGRDQERHPGHDRDRRPGQRRSPIPVGIGVALYLVEYGKQGKLADVVRYFVDVMTGVPSIVFGLFVYVTLVVGGGYAAWKGSVALALLMLPIVARSSEVVLLLVPDSLREAALALGTPRWRVVLRIVLPTAASGLVTGALLSVARAAGETAPLLFTASLVNGDQLHPRQAHQLAAPADLLRRTAGPGPSRRSVPGAPR